MDAAVEAEAAEAAEADKNAWARHIVLVDLIRIYGGLRPVAICCGASMRRFVATAQTSCLRQPAILLYKEKANETGDTAC